MRIDSSKHLLRSVLSPTLAALVALACAEPPPAQTPSSEEQAPAAVDEPTDTATEPSPAEAAPETAPAAKKKSEPVKLKGDGSTEFGLNDSTTARDAHGVTESKLEPTDTETAMRFFILDRSKKDSPIEGVVVAMTAPDGKKYYTEETDAKGYAEVLVPAGQKYELEYLSLGRRKIAAKFEVPKKAKQNIKLTLRYKRWTFVPSDDKITRPPTEVFVLQGVNFDTGKATIRPESFVRLDSVVEYMTHKKRVRIEISGHTDNVGKPEANKLLSQRRADACRDYLVKKGIDASRIETIGYGEERPVAPNDTPAGRQRNRRIEAREL